MWKSNAPHGDGAGVPRGTRNRHLKVR